MHVSEQHVRRILLTITCNLLLPQAAAEALASKVQEARRVPEMLVHEIR
jgi:hypothetical protein